MFIVNIILKSFTTNGDCAFDFVLTVWLSSVELGILDPHPKFIIYFLKMVISSSTRHWQILPSGLIHHLMLLLK